MTKEIIVYEDLAMVTIKNPDTKELMYRFTKWGNRQKLEAIINTKRIFSIQNETFPSRNFEKLEKFNGELPNDKILEAVQKKIRKYRSTFSANPPQGVLRKMTENAKKQI